jgi:NitT/TauT family transport system permease protein
MERDQVGPVNAADAADAVGAPAPGAPAARRRPPREPRRPAVWALQAAIVIAILLIWQYIPDVPGIRHEVRFADPFFISSPSGVANELWLIMRGAPNVPTIWAPLARTVGTALVGTLVACVLGAVGGLAVSSWLLLERVARPFLVLFNAIPRVAMIPIIILIVGASAAADAITAFTVVFFLVFYNAAEGASSVPRETIQNSALLGASNMAIMWKVRWPYAIGWTWAALPNAIAFGLVGTVTAEVFTGGSGIGYQLSLAIGAVNSPLLFAIVVVLAAVGVVLAIGSRWLRVRVLPWWESSEGV